MLAYLIVEHMVTVLLYGQAIGAVLGSAKKWIYAGDAEIILIFYLIAGTD